MSSGEIWRSTDGGKTDKTRKSNNDNGAPAQYLGKQGWYDNVVWAGDPTNSNLVVGGGIDLWRSTDGGNKLKRISQWNVSASVHADHHAIVEHPGYDGSTNRTVFFGNDGGVFRADNVKTAGNDPDSTSGWTSLVNCFAVTQFYAGAGNAATGVIVGGAQDNGTLAYHSSSGVNAWREILGGDGGYGDSDTADDRYFCGEYVYLELYRNDDGATTNDKWRESARRRRLKRQTR